MSVHYLEIENPLEQTSFVIEVPARIAAIEYAKAIFAGNSEGIREIGEVPNGIINGSNATFTTDFNFIPESVTPFINGLRQKLSDDFITSGNTTILFAVSLQIGDSILIDYERLI